MSTFDYDSDMDFFDSRDVIERIEELEAGATTDEGEFDLSMLDDEGREEYKALLTLQEEAGSEFNFGMTFVHEDYFETYARELAEDIGAINDDAGWPACHIDWEAAAESLKVDYTDFEVNGQTYYARA